MTDKRAVWQTGVARGAGVLGAALITTPLYARRIQALQEAKTPRQTAWRLGLLGGVGAGYGLVSGGIEGGLKAALGAPGTTSARKAMSALAASRTGMSLLTGLLSGYAIARGRQRAEEGKGGRYLLPAVVGGGAGFIKGLSEAALERRLGAARYGRGIKALIPAGMGRAGASLLSSLVLAHTVDRALKSMRKKEDGATRLPYHRAIVATLPAAMMMSVGGVAKGTVDQLVRQVAAKALRTAS